MVKHHPPSVEMSDLRRYLNPFTWPPSTLFYIARMTVLIVACTAALVVQIDHIVLKHIAARPIEKTQFTAKIASIDDELDGVRKTLESEEQHRKWIMEALNTWDPEWDKKIDEYLEYEQKEKALGRKVFHPVFNPNSFSARDYIDYLDPKVRLHERQAGLQFVKEYLVARHLELNGKE